MSWHPQLEKYTGFFIPSFLKITVPVKAVLGVKSVGMGNHVGYWGQVISEEQKTGNSVSYWLKIAVLKKGMFYKLIFNDSVILMHVSCTLTYTDTDTSYIFSVIEKCIHTSVFI